MPSETQPASIDSIIGRIQEEIGRRKRRANGHSAPGLVVARAGAGLPPPTDLIAADQALAKAQQTWRVGEQLPPMHRLTGLKRRLAAFAGKVFLRLSQLFTRDQREFNLAAMTGLQAVVSAIRAQSARWDNHLAEVLAPLVAQRSLLAEQLTQLSEHVARAHPNLDDRVGKLDARINDLTEKTLGGDGLKHLIVAIREELSAVARTHTTRLAQLRTSSILLEGRLAAFLEEAQKRLPHPFDESQLKLMAAELARMDEAVYSDFEAQFRGRWDEIKQRVSEYLPTIRDAGAGTAGRPVLDLGCGRGELLSALQDQGLVARGVELSHAFVEKARAAGLTVVEGDCLEYLRGLPDKSCGAVTGLHIVEHLPFQVLIAVLRESLRVLAPGGVAIFETPNPENMLVGACQFYLDPTHLRPLHPETMRFVAEANGFSQVEIRRLHPVSEEHHFPDDGSALVRRLNHTFHGPQDYAIVGFRA